MIIKRFLAFVVSSICIIAGFCQSDKGIDYRGEMLSLVDEIAVYSKEKNPRFLIIPQNGLEIAFDESYLQGLNMNYLKNIDAIGIESLNYGYNHQIGRKTPLEQKQYIISMIERFKMFNKSVLSIDYISDESQRIEVLLENNDRGYLSFPSKSRQLDRLIEIYNENSLDIFDLSQAQNFLYLINPRKYKDKTEFIDELSKTNWDVLIIDAFLGDQVLNKQDIQILKRKNNGSKRLVISYLSIGEVEDYRYYWNEEWNQQKPYWIEEENPIWQGNYKVWYWVSNWKNILIYQNDSYLNKILESEFDGVYLDLIDGFYYFEDKNEEGRGDL